MSASPIRYERPHSYWAYQLLCGAVIGVALVLALSLAGCSRQPPGSEAHAQRRAVLAQIWQAVEPALEQAAQAGVQALLGLVLHHGSSGPAAGPTPAPAPPFGVSIEIP